MKNYRLNTTLSYVSHQLILIIFFAFLVPYIAHGQTTAELPWIRLEGSFDKGLNNYMVKSANDSSLTLTWPKSIYSFEVDYSAIKRIYTTGTKKVTMNGDIVLFNQLKDRLSSKINLPTSSNSSELDSRFRLKVNDPEDLRIIRLQNHPKYVTRIKLYPKEEGGVYNVHKGIITGLMDSKVVLNSYGEIPVENILYIRNVRPGNQMISTLVGLFTGVVVGGFMAMRMGSGSDSFIGFGNPLPGAIIGGLSGSLIASQLNGKTILIEGSKKEYLENNEKLKSIMK